MISNKELLDALFKEVNEKEKFSFKDFFRKLWLLLVNTFLKFKELLKKKIKDIGHFFYRFFSFFKPTSLRKIYGMKNKKRNLFYYLSLVILSIVFILPLYIVFISSFKSKFDILLNPFSFPNEFTLRYYENGVKMIGFFEAFWTSLFVTVFSVLAIVLFTSMTSWAITRVKTFYSKVLYYLFVLSMVVPFQLVMYPMVFYASRLNLDNIIGIIIIYLGFGSGLSVFIFSGFIKSIPKEIEEAAMIDGCNPIQTFFRVVLPILKPTLITVAILNAMWIWNDFLLPSLILNDQRTIPVAIQMGFINSYGGIEYSFLTALITLSIIPIIIFYLALQKYIIKGISEGAIK